MLTIKNRCEIKTSIHGDGSACWISFPAASFGTLNKRLLIKQILTGHAMPDEAESYSFSRYLLLISTLSVFPLLAGVPRYGCTTVRPYKPLGVSLPPKPAHCHPKSGCPQPLDALGPPTLWERYSG